MQPPREQGRQSDVGAYLRSCREALGLTLREVEAKTGISNGYLSQLETGQIKRPAPNVLHQLASCYEVSYRHLLKLAGHLVPEEERETTRSIPEIPLKAIEELDPEDRQMLAEYIHFLRERGKKRKNHEQGKTD